MIAAAQKTIADLNDGRGIQSVDVQYYLSTSATALSGGSWSTTSPAWVDGKFIWSKTVTTYTDGGTKESAAVCITGATGSTGKGVSSITEQYYLSTSKTSQTGGSWAATPPAWSVGKYMWTRSVITYTDGTTTYTTPYCDAGWEAVNGLEIGGRNLLRNTKGIGAGYGDYVFTMGATYSVDTDGFTVATIPATGGWTTMTFTIPDIPVADIGGRQVTLSAWVQSAALKTSPAWYGVSCGVFSADRSIRIRHTDLGLFDDTRCTNQENYKNGKWSRFIWTGVLPAVADMTVDSTKSTYAEYGIGLWVWPDATSPLKVKKVKLEFGNIATDWTPAPEDTIPARRNLIENSSLLSNTTGWNHRADIIYEWAEDSSGSPCGVYLTKAETTKRSFPLSRHPTKAPEQDVAYTISAEVCKYGSNEIPSGSTIFARWYDVNGNYLERCTIDIPTNLTTRWTRLSATGLYTPAAEWAYTDCTVAMGNDAGSLGVRRIKLEIGTTATEWTAAPEDYVDTLEMGMELTSVKAEIANLGNSIRQEVSANYAASNDVVELSKKMQTLSEQSEDKFGWYATEIETMKTALGNATEATEEQLRLIQTYMTFSQSGLTIGKTGNPFTFRVVNDRLAFFMNETEVAYLSNNKLYVTQAEILKSMKIGKFAFEPQTNGNLSLVYTG